MSVRAAGENEVPRQEVPTREVAGQEMAGQKMTGQEMTGQKMTGQKMAGQEMPRQQVPRPTITDTCLRCAYEHSRAPVSTEDLLAACEVCIVVSVAVVFSALSLNYTIDLAHGYAGPMLPALLRVLGSLVVDLVSFYLILKGYTACAAIEATQPANDNEYDPGGGTGFDSQDNSRDNSLDSSQYIYCKAIFRRVFPDLLISTLLYCLLCSVLCMSSGTGGACIWSWLNLGLAPCLLSPFVDVNPANTYRAVNEMLWIVQVHTLFLLSSSWWYKISRGIAVRITSYHRVLYVVGTMWVGTFAQLYVAAVYPMFINVVTKNIFTNIVFFLVGILIRFMSSTSDDLRQFHIAIQSTVGYVMLFPRYSTFTLGMVLSLVYLHHLFPYSETVPCVSVFGGGPCLWMYDICTARMLPVQALFMLWLTDDGTLFENYLFGPIPVSITVVFHWAIKELSRYRGYCLTILLYSEFILFGLHTMILFVLPYAVTSCVHFVVPLEVGLVLVLCFYLSDLSNVLLGGMFDRISEYVCNLVFDTLSGTLSKTFSVRSAIPAESNASDSGPDGKPSAAV